MAVASKKKKIFDGRYEVLSIVGRGACSVVYHARHASGSSAEVALKVLLNQKGGTPSTDRLRKEALAMVSSRHKYVVRLDDFHSVQDLCYLSMEYAQEGDLRKYSDKKGKKLPIDQAILFYQQCCEALNFIHRVGITHRDLKPDNILVVSDSEIRLADFGVAVLPGEHASLDDLRAGVGTMSYMAPEVLEGRGCDKLSDIYSLGVSFYEMISGKHPFDNVPLVKQLEVREDKNIPPISSLAPGISPVIANAIMRSLRYDPAERFQTTADLVKTLAENAPLEVTVAKQKASQFKPLSPSSEVAKPTVLSKAPKNIGARKELRFDKKKPTSATAISAPLSAQENQLSSQEAQATDEQQPIAESAPDKSIESIEDIFDFEDDNDIDEMIDNLETPASENEKELESSESDSQFMDEEESFLEDEIEEPQVKESAAESLHGENENNEDEPAEKTSYLSKPEASQDAINPNKPKRPSLISTIIGIALILYACNFILKHIFNVRIFGSSTESETVEAPAGDSILPLVKEAPRSFPYLPAGIYSGEIQDVLPGETSPLVIISIPERESLAVIVGIEGWSPGLISLPAAANTDGENQKIRVASNGMVLDMTGLVKDGVIQGSFKNAVSGVSGDWHVTPLK